MGGRNGAPAQVRVLGQRLETEGRVQALCKREHGGRRCLEVSSGKIKVGCELPDSVFSVHFLQFHPTILKPDFHLSVRKVDATADL